MAAAFRKRQLKQTDQSGSFQYKQAVENSLSSTLWVMWLIVIVFSIGTVPVSRKISKGTHHFLTVSRMLYPDLRFAVEEAYDHQK